MLNLNSIAVAVLGASDRRDRYSYQAIQMLQEHGLQIYPISHRKLSLPGLTTYASIAELPVRVHTMTLYVNPSVVESLADEIARASPERVIFNPGTENPVVQQRLQQEGIRVVEACTLVLLRTNQFAHA